MSPQSEALGYDTHFQVGNTTDIGTATSFTDVFAELVDVDPPEQDTAKIKSKHMQSPNQVEQIVLGWQSPGVCKIKAHYNATEWAAVRAYGRAQNAFRIVFNDPNGSSQKSGVAFNAFVTKMGRKPDIEALVEDTFEFSVTGPVTDLTALTGVS